MPNRLAAETSPYLLQHVNNPVDWYPWGEEAMEKARRENKPIFLSIGYSACHWCHVMERESFEDPGIARKLNEHFVSIKVDREERPDLDQVYMMAVQILTGRGGWPASLFLTPDLKPFFGGTYWPPARRYGMPSFSEVLDAVADAWRGCREQVVAQAQELARRVADDPIATAGRKNHDAELARHAQAAVERAFDPIHGGFGGAPKFPHQMILRFLLRVYDRNGRPETLHMVTHTLERMTCGGIYDHLGGGFHRYSVDEGWLVPHFEKMLYDNALLTTCLVEAFQVTGAPCFARAARETCNYVLREMTGAEGAFHSAQDADSEGEEGKFYLWTRPEVEAVLGPAAGRFCYVYDVSQVGNFEGRCILHLPRSISQAAKINGWDEGELHAELAQGREKLLAARNQRVSPARDDKILASWNGLMIEALALAAGGLGEPRYLRAAERAADFILSSMRDERGRLLRAWRAGRGRFLAYLEDHACLANALIELYQASFAARWIDEALLLADAMLDRFWDARLGDFYYTPHDHEPTIARRRDFQDASVPSSSGMAATVLLRLGRLTGRADLSDAALEVLQTNQAFMRQAPIAAGQLLLALDFSTGPVHEIVLAAANQAELRETLGVLQRQFRPRAVLAGSAPDLASPRGLSELLRGREPVAERPTLFVCENFACRAPLVGREAICSWSSRGEVA